MVQKIDNLLKYLETDMSAVKEIAFGFSSTLKGATIVVKPNNKYKITQTANQTTNNRYALV